jgi:hypothetical protein
LISTKLRQILEIFKDNIGGIFLGGGGWGQFGPSSRENTFQSWHMQVHEHMKFALFSMMF